MKLPKRCDTYPRILWPTEVKLKPPTKPDEVTKKKEKVSIRNPSPF